MRFGYHYCREYVFDELSFAPETQTVLAKIRSCLVERVLHDQDLTCSNTEERAMKDHLNCYMAAGFCVLPLSEKLKIFKVAWTEVQHSSFRKTMSEVNRQCSSQLNTSNF